MKRKEGKHKESGTDLTSYTVKSSVAPVQHSYKVGENYMTKADLNVRVTAAGALKRWDKLTTSGKSHSDNVDGYAVMQKGTTVTCKEIKIIGANVWMRIPSGWIAAIAKDKKYCIDDRSLNVICKVVVNHIQVFYL